MHRSSEFRRESNQFQHRRSEMPLSVAIHLLCYHYGCLIDILNSLLFICLLVSSFINVSNCFVCLNICFFFLLCLLIYLFTDLLVSIFSFGIILTLGILFCSLFLSLFTFFFLGGRMGGGT